MRGAGGGPKLWGIYARNDHLAIGEFHQPGEVRFHVRSGQTFRKKNDGTAGAMQSGGHGIVVADGVLPLIQNAALFKHTSPNGRASAPAKIPGGVFAKHSKNGSVPRRQQQARQIVFIGNQPAHGRRGADSGVGQRRGQPAQPGVPGAAIGIGEHEHFKFFRQLQNRRTKIVDLFPTLNRSPREDDVSFRAGLGCDAPHNAHGGIRL